MLIGAAIVGAVVCALAAVRAGRVVAAGLWLASTSALLALTLYLLDAPYVAVIELSVGAGLVSVLFVLAITTTGDETRHASHALPGWIVVGLPALAIGLLGWLLLPGVQPGFFSQAQASFGEVLWQQRGLDLFGQVVLLFVAALGVLALLEEVSV
jgi:NADH:ubiquinone oxidoreductase subunit 6 (subunit J)